MDESRFDNLARSLGSLRTRRNAILSFGGLTVLPTIGEENGKAKGRRCKKSQSKCKGACVNLNGNRKHCGACGNKCLPGAKCASGQCTLTGNPPQCVENDNNCGGCGKACSRDTYCYIGQCVPRYENDLTIPTPRATPYAIFVDATGDIFVAGGLQNCVLRLTSSGVLKRTFGVCGSPQGNGMDQFHWAKGVIAYGPNIIISDNNNHRIQIFGPDDTAAWMTLRTGPGSSPNQVDWPDEMAMDRDGNFYLTDMANNRVTKFNASWARMMQFGTGVAGSSTLQLDWPAGVAVDRNGRVHVADSGNHRIMVFAPDGSFLRSIGSLGTAPGRLHFPESVAVASNGDIFVAEGTNARVQQFDSVGNLIRVFPLPSGAGAPLSVAVDSADNLYMGTAFKGIYRYSLKAAKPSA